MVRSRMRTAMAPAQMNRISELAPNTQCHPQRSVIAWAVTCPNIPATRNAVDIAPIAVPLQAGGVESLR